MNQPSLDHQPNLDQPSFIQPDALISKLERKVKELNAHGFTQGDQEILNHRLNFIWTTETTTIGKKGSATLWRNTRARRVYTEIQNANNHLLLVVILVIPPTECSKATFDKTRTRLISLETYEPYRLNLNLSAKRFLESIATEHGFASSCSYLNLLEDLFPPPDAGDAVYPLRKRKRVTSRDVAQSEPAPVPEASSARRSFVDEDEVIENASLQGIAKVFSEYMCGAIRRVTVQNDLKAAVTMVLPPWGGPVDCLISLDIHEQEVGSLATALFNAKVKWVGQALHVTLKDGMTFVIPNSEATLKGVLNEDIAKVFGPEIHDAIAESPIHMRELEEGKCKTECVSMILTKNGAIISLSLGLEGGLTIKKKLYT